MLAWIEFRCRSFSSIFFYFISSSIFFLVADAWQLWHLKFWFNVWVCWSMCLRWVLCDRHKNALISQRNSLLQKEKIKTRISKHKKRQEKSYGNAIRPMVVVDWARHLALIKFQLVALFQNQPKKKRKKKTISFCRKTINSIFGFFFYFISFHLCFYLALSHCFSQFSLLADRDFLFGCRFLFLANILSFNWALDMYFSFHFWIVLFDEKCVFFSRFVHDLMHCPNFNRWRQNTLEKYECGLRNGPTSNKSSGLSWKTEKKFTVLFDIYQHFFFWFSLFFALLIITSHRKHGFRCKNRSFKQFQVEKNCWKSNST